MPCNMKNRVTAGDEFVLMRRLHWIGVMDDNDKNGPIDRPKLGFGKRIQEARKALPHKVTQEELGKACGWKDAQSRVSNYEIERNEPSIQDFIALGNATHVDPGELAFGKPLLGPEEAKLLHAWRVANPAMRKYIRGAADAALEQYVIDGAKKVGNNEN
jgi:transcriptional regulator with XRE-family HTH domain